MYCKPCHKKEQVVKQMKKAGGRKSNRNSRKRHSFGKFATSFKISKILKDIAEARNLGIELNSLTLSELHSSLKRARQQKQVFEKHHPDKVFRYDSGEDSQLPNDGLDELKEKILDKAKSKRRSKR